MEPGKNNGSGQALEKNLLAIPEQAEVTREPLFPDEMPDDRPIINTMDATLKIRVIRAIEKQIEQLDLQDKESRFFYAEKKCKCEEQIDFMKRSLLAYLQLNGMKNIQTPAGTAYQRTVTARQWPEDDVLLAWAKSNMPEGIRRKEEPDKKLIGEHIRVTGDMPEGYTERKETRLMLK